MTQPEFIIERHKHGWLIKATPGQRGVPMNALSDTSGLFQHGAVLCARISRATASVFAIATPKDATAWEAEIAEVLEKAALPPELKWLRGADTGASSKTLFFHLCGGNYAWQVEASGGKGFDRMTDVPHDADDFGRCNRLLTKFPAWRERLPEMAVKLPHTKWPKLVAIWHELEQLDSPMKRNELTRRIQAV